MKPQILHLIGSNSVGGPEKQILHHAVDVQDSQYEVRIGSFQDQAKHPEILFEAEQRHLRTVCFGGGVRLRLILDLLRFLREQNIALLCTHGFKANVLGYLVSLRSPTQHVAFLRGWTAETGRVIFYEKLERQALARAQTVVCVSRLQAEQVRKLRGARSAPRVIENAMLPPFVRKTDKAPPTRESLNIAANAFIFGSVGRLSAEKGHLYLVQAFAELRKTAVFERPLCLVMVGDGREDQALERLSVELGIREHIYFAGYQGNCTEWMELMDCLVQPSLTEGTPNAILEAMCVGIPVVATAVGGVPALIRNGDNGMLVPPADSAALAATMQRVLLQPQLRSALVSSATATQGEYAPARQRAHYFDLYKSLSLTV